MVSLRLPDVDLGNEPVAAFDAAIETLAFEHADLDLNHVEPAGVLGRVVELKPPEHAARFGRWESGVESGSGVGGEVIEDDADALGLWEVDIDEFAHAKGEAVSGATITLERAGLIRRTPGVARSIEILVEPEDPPVLR